MGIIGVLRDKCVFFRNFTPNKTAMNKLFLIDAYALIFRSYYALIRAPRINSKGLNTSAILGFVNTLYEIITKEQPTHLGVAFDLGKTFRHEAYPPYKAQREETPEAIRQSVPIIQEILHAFHIPILQKEDLKPMMLLAHWPQKPVKKAWKPTCLRPIRTTDSW